MFLPCHVAELGDTSRKDLNMVVGGESCTSGIDFFCAIDLYDPCKEVLDHPLIKLMEGVRHDGAIDGDRDHVNPFLIHRDAYTDGLTNNPDIDMSGRPIGVSKLPRDAWKETREKPSRSS